MERDPLRAHLTRLLDWHDAHVDFDTAMKDLAPELRGVRPHGLPYSPWRLLEHLRLTQRDILDFCRDPAYIARTWPDDYWPESDAPPDADAWDRSLSAFRDDRDQLKRIAADPAVDLFAPVPRGEGQTFLRELLLVADHNAYHLGEMVVARRLLGAWPP